MMCWGRLARLVVLLLAGAAAAACGGAPAGEEWEEEPFERPKAGPVAEPEPPSPREARTLLDKLGHADWRVRERAMRGLIALGGPARELAREALASPDPEVRRRADYILQRLRRTLGVPPLDRARALYASAALARSREGNGEVARRLYQEVVERFPTTKWAGAAHVRLAAPRRKAEPVRPEPPAQAEIPRLVALLGAASWRERQDASHRLARLGPAARAALEDAAASSNAELAWRAQRLLERLRANRTAGPAAPKEMALPRVRLLLGRAGPARLTQGTPLERILEALESNDPDRVVAARRLLLTRGRRGIERLARSLRSCSEVAGVEVMDLLRQITGKDFGFDPARWIDWWRAENERTKD